MVSVTEIYESAVGKSSSQQRRCKNGLKEVEENPQLNIVTEATETLEICGVTGWLLYKSFMSKQLWKTVHRIISLFEESQ